MNNQQPNITKTQEPKKKKKGLKALFITLGIVVCASAALVTCIMINRNTQKQIENRFNYQNTESPEMKLATAFEAGEIDADTYVRQLAYSMYNVSLLDDEYKSDNTFDLAPDLFRVASAHSDELSDETISYLAEKFSLSDVIVDEADDEQETPVTSKSLFTLDVNAISDGSYDVSKLDKAYLSKSGRFIFFYTTKGNSAISKSAVKKLANDIEDITEDIEEYLGIEWKYEPSIDYTRNTNFMRILLKNGITDGSVMSNALPVYIYEPKDCGTTAAWYMANTPFLSKLAIKMFGELTAPDSAKEAVYIYSYPYIVIRTQASKDQDELLQTLCHEVAHHFESIYYDDIDYTAPDFPSETIADLVAVNVFDTKTQNGILFSHLNYFYMYPNLYPSGAERLSMELREGLNGNGYVDMVWGQSYLDVVDDGLDKMMQALLSEHPGKFLQEQAGDQYSAVLEDLAERSLTKDYKQSCMQIPLTPAGMDSLNLRMDYRKNLLVRNQLNYYYIDTDELCHEKTQVFFQTTSDSMFIKVMGRKGLKYSVISTTHPKAEEKILILDGCDKQYKKYDEVVLIVGIPSAEIKHLDENYYKLVSINKQLMDSYQSFTGIADLDVFSMSEDGSCITLYVDDCIEAAKNAADGTASLSQFLKANIDQSDEEGRLLAEELDTILSDLETFGVDLDTFNENFPYEVIRIFTMDLDTSAKTDDELHEEAINMLSVPKLRLIDLSEENSRITVDASFNPLSNTELTFGCVITANSNEPKYYKIEFDKKK